MERNALLAAGEARRLAAEAARLLSEEPRVTLVYLFGSAAGAGPRPVRDVDLAVRAAPPFSLGELMRQRARLGAATGAPIDLVSLDEASVTLAHEVVEGGVCLYARTPDIETEFVTRTRARYWDFRPFREAQWQLAGERLAARRRLAGRRDGP